MSMLAVTSNNSKRFNPFSLDAVNFLLSDVRGALGPYLNVFLVTQQHWSQSEVGLVTTIGGLLGLVVQTPIGAAIDETRAKRGAIVLALAVLGVGAVIIFARPSFWPVLFANSLMAIVGDVGPWTRLEAHDSIPAGEPFPHRCALHNEVDWPRLVRGVSSQLVFCRSTKERMTRAAIGVLRSFRSIGVKPCRTPQPSSVRSC
jgi:Major Facilitator Superfamily